MADPVVAFCTIAALDRPLSRVVEMAADAGFGGLEITARPPHVDDEASLDGLAAIGEEVRRAGLEVVAYGSYLSFVGPGSGALARRDVERARAVGASRLRVWAAHVGGAAEEHRRDVVRLLQATSALAADAGLDVVVERHEGTFADTVDRTTRLLADVARPNVWLNYQTLDGMRRDEASRVHREVELLVPLSRYVHLKNYVCPDGDDVLQLGGDLRRGIVDYRALLPAIAAAGFDGPYAIEFVGADGRALEEKLADGLSFVREALRTGGCA